jgi:general secretion pathway protein B
MSYILDALRRAEADRERERGQVPGLHTPASPGATPHGAPAPAHSLRWAAGGLLLLAGVAAGVWWAHSTDPTPPPGPAEPTATMPAPNPPPNPHPTTPPAAAPTPPPATVPASQAESPIPQHLPTAAAPAASPYLPANPEPLDPPARRAPAPAAAPAERIPLLSELPEALRRELPKLSLGGSVYSDDAASRLVIINGELLREGASIGPQLVLEQIRPRELVMRFKGQRFRQQV